MHVKARAFKEGLLLSPVSQASYWVVGMVDAGLHDCNRLCDRTEPYGPGAGLGRTGRRSERRPPRAGSRRGPAGVAGGFRRFPSRPLALDSLGQVWAWGYNHEGQLADGTYTYHYRPALVSGLDDVVAVSAGGGDHSLALKADGTVWAWGSNASEESWALAARS